jgi:hypothetical protein
MMTKPTLAAVSDPKELLVLLAEAYADIASLLRAQLPSSVPNLKAVTLPTHAALRKQVGDLNGENGPRACIVTGRVNPLDGGEGVFVWDPTSTLTDDDINVIQPGDSPSGRWRKGSF